MPVSPDEFLWISILTGFSFLLLSGFVYVVLCPCQLPVNYFWKRKDKMASNNNNDCNIFSNVEGYSKDGQFTPPNGVLIHENPPGTPRPVITGPQGHGFYTSGPWRIETLGHDNLAMQFTQPQLMMGDYFNMMGPSAPAANQEESDPSQSGLIGGPDAQPCHMMGNLIMCSNSWASNNNECERYCHLHSMGIGMDNSLIDMGHSQSDSDMMMMGFM